MDEGIEMKGIARALLIMTMIYMTAILFLDVINAIEPIDHFNWWLFGVAIIGFLTINWDKK